MKQLDVEVSTPAKDFRYDLQLAKTDSKTCRLTTSPHSLDCRAGKSPTFWTRGLAMLGLAGTRGLASPIEELLSFKTSPSLSRLSHWNRRYLRYYSPTPSQPFLQQWQLDKALLTCIFTPLSQQCSRFHASVGAQSTSSCVRTELF